MRTDLEKWSIFWMKQRIKKKNENNTVRLPNKIITRTTGRQRNSWAEHECYISAIHVLIRSRGQKKTRLTYWDEFPSSEVLTTDWLNERLQEVSSSISVTKGASERYQNVLKLNVNQQVQTSSLTQK